MTSLPFTNYDALSVAKPTTFQSSISHALFVMSLNISRHICPLQTLLFAKGTVVSTSDCQQVNLSPGSFSEAPEEFAGACFKFRIALTNHNEYSFKVYLSAQVGDIEQYLNNFCVLLYSDGKTQEPFREGMFDIVITDEFYESFKGYEPLLYRFTSDKIPLEWKSYGQFITVKVRIQAMLKVKQFLEIALIANFQRNFVLSYLDRSPYIKHCNYTKGHYPTIDKCMSIHTNFSGSWTKANDICKKKGGYLWSINDLNEWNAILRSPKYQYRGNKWDPPNKFNPINVAKYFRTSSVIFLGLHSQVLSK